MINLNEITREVIDNVKEQGPEQVSEGIDAFAHTEMISDMFTNVAMNCETLALATCSDPKFTSAIRTLMFVSFQVGKLAGRQEVMDETLKGINWDGPESPEMSQ